jgi:hypothetical protein
MVAQRGRERDLGGVVAPPRSPPRPRALDARRKLQLALAGIWLLDAALQFQPFMFTKAFSQTLAGAASGNPAVIAGPVTWSARIIGQQPAAANAVFATIQLLLALGLAWRPAVKVALAASAAWSLGVWWLGEGLGGVLTPSASPVNGAPGAAAIYALLAVLLWPAGRDGSPPFAAARAIGALPARLLWLALWGSLAYFALRAGNMMPQGMQDMISAMAAGEPGWIAAIDHGAAALLAHHGPQVSAILAVVLEIVAVGVFLPAPAARGALIAAAAVALAIWVVGENFGAVFTGSATDPNSGPLLALLAAAYWPAGSAGGEPPGPGPRPECISPCGREPADYCSDLSSPQVTDIFHGGRRHPSS